MRLIRLGAETAKVGVDVRSALASWGVGDAVLGGVGLLGVTQIGRTDAVEAILILPHGVVVVLAIDLPDPALRLDAPLGGQWKADGWPLVRPDGVINPATEALAEVNAIAERLRSQPADSIPMSVVIAVGPYVSEVTQPADDLHRGVRVLHPQPKPLLTAVRELTGHNRPRTVAQTRQLLRVLLGTPAAVSTSELVAEGFEDAAKATDPAIATTMRIPRITAALLARRPLAPAAKGGNNPRGQLRWLPIGAAVLLAALLLAGIGVAVASSLGGSSTNQSAGAPQIDDLTVAGQRFSPKGSTEGQDCAGSSYGDVQVWLSQHRCTQLARSVYQTSVDDRPSAVALATVSFADPGTARSFGAVVNTPGSGGIVDLVKQGTTWPGGPKFFDGAAYTVVVQGDTVRIIEAVWVNAHSTPTDSALHALTVRAEGLPAVP